MRMSSGAMLLLVSLSAYGQGRVALGQSPPWPPASGTSYFMLQPSPGSQPKSLKELCASALIIFDGTVQATLPVRQITSSRRLETDIVFGVDHLLKGPNDVKTVVVTQRGGVLGAYTEQPLQYALMHTGERYLLFAEDDKRLNVSVVSGASRYWIVGEWVGAFRVDGRGNIQLSSGSPEPLRNKYEALSLKQLITEVGGLLK